MTRYPGGSFEMSGGTLDCKGLNTTLNQNYFRLNGGTVILRGHASGSTSAADAGGSVITNECGYYLGGVTIKPISGNTTGSAGNVNFTGNTQVCLTGINGDTVIDRSGDIYTANFDSGVKLVGPGGLNTFGNHALTIAGHVEFTGRLTCGSYYLYLTPSSTLAGPEEIVVASDGHLILRGKIEKSPKRLCVDGELANDSGDFNTLTVEEFVYKGVDKPNGTYTSANLPALKRLTIVVQKPTEWLADGKGSLSGLPDGTVKTLTEPVTLTELTCGSVAGGTNTVTGAAVTFADGAVIDVQKGNTLVIGTDVVLAGKVTKTGFGKVVFNGKVSAPDGVDLSQAANDVFWLTVRHGSADFDGTVTGVRIASCSGDGDTPLVVLGEHCTVSNRAIVLTAYCEDGSVKNCRGETHQEGAVLDYTTLPAGIAATYSVVPMSRPFGGCGRYVLTSGEIRTLKAFSFVPKWDDQGSFDFVQDGGTITSEDGWSFARNSSGQMFTYTLNDGLVHLRAGFSSYNSNMARIVLNGGRIWSYGSAVYLLKRDNVTLEVNGAVTIEVPEGRTTACTTPFAGTGTVTFTGGGTLQLSGPYELATFTALQGATAFYAEAAAAMSADCAFTVEKGAKLDLAYDGEMTIGSLVYDGRERRGRVYHAGEASAVGRMLLGTGDLNVLTGDGPGLTILIR